MGREAQDLRVPQRASAVFHALGMLPTAAVGTGAWWLEKLPLIGLSALALAWIVAKVNRFERRALLAPRTPWAGGPASMTVVALALSAGVKMWANADVTVLGSGLVLVTLVWFGALQEGAPAMRPNRRSTGSASHSVES